MRRSDLEQKVRELTEFFDSMPAMVWFKDTHNRLLRINLRAAQSAGKSPQEMEGRAMEELYPLQAAGYLADDQEVVQSRSPKLGIIETISDGDGQIHWIQTDKVPIFGPEGEVKGVLVLAQDISRRKLAEESLRLLSSAVEQSKEAILITDADLVPPGPHIVFVNPAFTRMSGYSAEEVMGQSPRILQGPRTDQAALEKMKDTLRQGIPFEGESVNYRKDGQEFLSEWQVTPLRDEAGTVTHIVALHRDITVRRRMESQLFQAHKLETVGKLAGGVAQEFNTILTSILGQAQLLLHDLSPGSALRIHVLDIQQAAERAARLTSQLLAYGRKQFLSTRVLDLGRLLTDLEDTLRQLMGPSIQVRLRLSPGLRKVRADPAQLEQDDCKPGHECSRGHAGRGSPDSRDG